MIIAIITTIFLLIVVPLIVLHNKAIDMAFTDMSLLRLVSHNRLMSTTIFGLLITLILPPIVNMFIIGLLALLWLVRTIMIVRAVQERYGDWSMNNMNSYSSTMLTDDGAEIDGDAVQDYLDGKADSVKEAANKNKGKKSDEKSDKYSDEEHDPEVDDCTDDVNKQKNTQKTQSVEEYKFEKGQVVTICNLPAGYPSNMSGRSGEIRAHIPNIQLVRKELDKQHGYIIAGFVHPVPENCLK